MKILKIIEIQTFIEYLFCIEFLVEFLHFFQVRSYFQLQDLGFGFADIQNSQQGHDDSPGFLSCDWGLDSSN